MEFIELDCDSSDVWLLYGAASPYTRHGGWIMIDGR